MATPLTPSETPEPLEAYYTAPILAHLTVHVPVQGTAKKYIVALLFENRNLSLEIL